MGVSFFDCTLSVYVTPMRAGKWSRMVRRGVCLCCPCSLGGLARRHSWCAKSRKNDSTQGLSQPNRSEVSASSPTTCDKSDALCPVVLGQCN